MHTSTRLDFELIFCLVYYCIYIHIYYLLIYLVWLAVGWETIFHIFKIDNRCTHINREIYMALFCLGASIAFLAKVGSTKLAVCRAGL